MTMESFNNFYFTVTFFINFTFLLKSSPGFEALQPHIQGSSAEMHYAPGPLSSYEKHLSKCVSNLAPHCREEIFFNVFVGNQTVNFYCCFSLKKFLGKSCHMDITNNALKLPMFKKNKIEVLNRSLKLWDECSSYNYLYWE